MYDEKLTTGVIGAGSFGTVIANLLAKNAKVLLYTRKPEVHDAILKTRQHLGRAIHENITPTTDLEEITRNCTLIFPSVPSANFRELMRELSPYLLPSHILIHCTKGLDVQVDGPAGLKKLKDLSRQMVRTMSEVILEESVVVRVGCLAGPNLADELAEGQPAATVIASKFEEVIRQGMDALRSPDFQVYGNHDITGVELAGALKNIIAIAAGAVSGMGYGENIKALLISKGIGEMIRVGQALGGDKNAFLGLAGIGDLVATCFSEHSRNFSIGKRLAGGEQLDEILATMEEVAEGVNTTLIVKCLVDHYRVRAPIIQIVHRALFEGMSVKEGIDFLMRYPIDVDVDFLPE